MRPSCLFTEAQQYGTLDVTMCLKYVTESSSTSTRDCHVCARLSPLQCELVISNGTLATTHYPSSFPDITGTRLPYTTAKWGLHQIVVQTSCPQVSCMPFLICARHKPSVVSDTAMLRLENGSNPFVLFYVLIWIEGHILLNMQVPSYYYSSTKAVEWEVWMLLLFNQVTVGMHRPLKLHTATPW